MNKTNLLITLGKIYQTNGNTERALETFEAILDEAPRNVEALCMASELNEQAGKYEAAAEWMHKAIPCATSPSQMLEMQQKLGALYIAANQHFKAIRVFQAVEELAKNVNTPAVAEIAAVEEVKMSDDNPHVWNELGLVLYKVGSFDDAIDAYQNALKIDNNLPFVHSNLAQAYLSQGKLDESLSELEAMLKNTDGNEALAEVWNRIKTIYKLQNETEKATLAERISAELGNNLKKNETRFANVEIEKLDAKDVSAANLDELTRSIRLHGVLQPLIVTPSADGERYAVVAGNRRYSAAKIAGLQSVPAIIRNLTEAESIEISLHENMHNEIKDSQTLAGDLQKLATEYDYSINQLADRLGVSSYAVANSLKTPAMQPTSSEPALESDMIRKMINQLGTETIENSDDAVAITEVKPVAEPELWYMAGSTQNAEPIKVERNSLFSRAASMLRQNPHPARVW